MASQNIGWFLSLSRKVNSNKWTKLGAMAGSVAIYSGIAYVTMSWSNSPERMEKQGQELMAKMDPEARARVATSEAALVQMIKEATSKDPEIQARSQARYQEALTVLGGEEKARYRDALSVRDKSKLFEGETGPYEKAPPLLPKDFRPDTSHFPPQKDTDPNAPPKKIPFWRRSDGTNYDD